MRGMMSSHSFFVMILIAAAFATAVEPIERPRIRELGVKPGVLPPGPLNTITDVAGVRVGHHTLVKGESVRTGVTAILPHAGNLFTEKVPCAIAVGNGGPGAIFWMVVAGFLGMSSKFIWPEPPAAGLFLVPKPMVIVLTLARIVP